MLIACLALLFANANAFADEPTLKTAPEVYYRFIGLTPNKDASFHKSEHKDSLQQLYLTTKFTASQNFSDEFVLEPTIRTGRTKYNDDNLDLIMEQAYVQASLIGALELTAGKKHEKEGSGFLVNPSDLPNINAQIFDELYNRRGKNMVRLTWRQEDFSLGLGYLPKNGGYAKEGRAWLKSQATALGTDATLQVTYGGTEKATTGLSLSRFFGDTIELHTEGRYQARQRPISEERERRYSAYTPDEGSAYYLAGTRIVAGTDRTILGEFINNQSGLIDEEFDAFLTDAKNFNDVEKEPDERLLGRNYSLLAYVDEALIPRTAIEASALVNIDDNSGFSTVKVRYFLSKIISIELYPVWFFGKDLTEFGEYPFSTVGYLTFAGRW